MGRASIGWARQLELELDNSSLVQQITQDLTILTLVEGTCVGLQVKPKCFYMSTEIKSIILQEGLVSV